MGHALSPIFIGSSAAPLCRRAFHRVFSTAVPLRPRRMNGLERLGAAELELGESGYLGARFTAGAEALLATRLE